MIRKPITPDLSAFPAVFHPFLQAAAVFDSSCSPNARVWFLDKGPGFYLKTAPKGALFKEASMTRFFHEKGLGAKVLAYESLEADWLLTERIPGEDCIDAMYLADPVRLDAFLDAIFEKAPLPVSVKTHIGFSSPDEFPEILEIFNRYPITQLILQLQDGQVLDLILYRGGTELTATLIWED